MPCSLLQRASILKMDQATIAAIATPTGSSGIGIIKISGEDSISIAASIFRRSGFLSDESGQPSLFLTLHEKSHQIFYGHIVDPKRDIVLDEVLLSVMLAPRSYTRENIVEINAHSGAVVLNAVLELVLQQGARLAEPGEFTKRAFLNGRIDLTQAEAVIDIINAKTTQALEFATNQIKGGLRKTIEAVLNSLNDIIIEVDAAIDFPDEVGEIFDKETLQEKLQTSVTEPLSDLIERYKRTKMLKNGIKTVIVGRPNVGKSSLMNCLIKKDRVIVSEIPGTTRDFIEEVSLIKNIPIVFTDTAGLHDTDDRVETIGINKTYEYIESAELVLFVVDMSDSLTEEDHQIYEKIEYKKKILVMNKSDLVSETFLMDIPSQWETIDRVKTSALFNRGIDEIENKILDTAIQDPEGVYNISSISPNLRHKDAVERSLNAVSTAIAGIAVELSLALVAIDLKEAVGALEEVTGSSVKGDVLDQIFSRFCIGK